MKKKLFAGLAGALLVFTGCVHTVSDTTTFAMDYSRDSVAGRYNRTWEQVYKAAFTVVKRDGAVVKEYVPYDYTNTVRQLEGRVNDRKVYVRVEQVDPRLSQVDVEARTTWGGTDLDLAHELEKEIALELSTY
jgi:hypothetical protein